MTNRGLFKYGFFKAKTGLLYRLEESSQIAPKSTWLYMNIKKLQVWGIA